MSEGTFSFDAVQFVYHVTLNALFFLLFGLSNPHCLTHLARIFMRIMYPYLLQVLGHPTTPHFNKSRLLLDNIS